MNITVLVSTPEREKTLGYLLERPTQKINMNKAARELGLSTGQIHKYVTILRGAGVVKKNELIDAPLTRALRMLWNLKRIENAGFVERLRRLLPNARGIGVFGSWAAGSNVEDSDLDLWVKMSDEPADSVLARVRRDLSERLKVQIDLTIATPKRLEHLKEKSDAFYYSLFNCIVLWGESL